MLFVLSTAFFIMILLAGGMYPVGFQVWAAVPLLCYLIWRPPELHRRHLYLWGCGLILAGLATASLLPIPVNWLDNTRSLFFSRVSHHLTWLQAVSDVPELTGAANSALHSGGSARLSLNYTGTVRFLGLFGIMWAGFWLTSQLKFQQRRTLLWFLVIAGSVTALLGILGQTIVPQGETVLWLIPSTHGNPAGPFVNRNHFALFCAILLPPALTLTLSPSLGRRGKRANIPLSILALTATGILTAAVFVSLSRSGMLTLATAAGTTALLWIKARPHIATLAVSLGLMIILGLIWWPSAKARQRIETLHTATQTSSAQARFKRWEDTLSIWKDFPITGCGMGAFRTVYPVYKTANSRKSALHCENEYLEILAEGGLLAAIPTTLFLGFYFSLVLKKLLARQNNRGGIPTNLNAETESSELPEAKLLTIISLGAAAAIAIHAFFDFGMRIPLNAFTAAILLGLTVNTRIRPATRATENEAKIMRQTFTRSSLSALLVVIVAAAFTCAGRWNYDRGNRLANASTEAVFESLTRAPCYWSSWHESSRRIFDTVRYRLPPARKNPARQRLIGEGLACLRQSTDYNSYSYRTWMTLAAAENVAGYPAMARKAALRAIALRPYLQHELDEYLQK